MQISSINTVLVDNNKLRAYANIELEGDFELAGEKFPFKFIVRGVKVIRTNKGFLVAMPNKKGKNDLFRDVCHPLNTQTRELFEAIVMLDFHSKANGKDEKDALEFIEREKLDKYADLWTLIRMEMKKRSKS